MDPVRFLSHSQAMEDSIQAKENTWCGCGFRGYQSHIIMRRQAIGGQAGTVREVDRNTRGIQRGKFARIAVEVDLNKPLMSKIRIDGLWYLVEYESLPQICPCCGKAGHDWMSD